MRAIDLSNISRYRKPVMGAAILFIMLFHAPMDDAYMMCHVKKLGNIGVDMFFFLSGIGLWFSWIKNPDLKRFYHRRFWRIYPEYFIMACLFYIPDYMRTSPFESHDMMELITNISLNLCFWTRGARTFWFIPAIMVLYLSAPFYMNLIRRDATYKWLPVIFILVCTFLSYNDPLCKKYWYLIIFLSRIPIFLIGITCGELVYRKRSLPPSSWVLIALIFVAAFVTAVNFTFDLYGRYPTFLMMTVYIPLSITGILILTEIFTHTKPWMTNWLSFLGGITLEVYLIHEHFALSWIEGYDLGYCLTSLISIPIAIISGWLLHRFCHLRIWTGHNKKIPNKMHE